MFDKMKSFGSEFRNTAVLDCGQHTTGRIQFRGF